MIRIVQASLLHTSKLARSMRAIDVAECRAFGREPKDALRRSLAASLHAFTVLDGDRPIAMFGVVSNLMTRRGVPWFLGADEVFDHARELLTIGPRIIAEWHQDFDVMENLVGADNHRAIRLLGKWGAVVGRDEQVYGGMAFRPFQFCAVSSDG